MKHPFFAFLGSKYPLALEQQYERILCRIEELWNRPEIEDYFSDLIVDRRGGRKGFPKPVLDEILMLRDIQRSEKLRKADEKERALAELRRRGIPLGRDEFLAAVKLGDRGLVDLLVQANVNIHVVDDDGTPPLIIALRQGFTVIASILVRAGADVNQYDRLGETPLLLACGKPGKGYREVAEELIIRGAHINERDRNGYTPLMLSLAIGDEEIAAMLVERGADVNAGTLSGITPLSLARASGNPRLVELLTARGAR